MLLQHLGNLKQTMGCHGMQVGNLQGNFVSIDADMLAGDWRGEIRKLGQSVTKVRHCLSLVQRSNDAYRNSQLNVSDIDALLTSCFVTAEHQRCSTVMVSLMFSDVLFRGSRRFQGRVEPSTPREAGEHGKLGKDSSDGSKAFPFLAKARTKSARWLALMIESAVATALH